MGGRGFVAAGRKSGGSLTYLLVWPRSHPAPNGLAKTPRKVECRLLTLPDLWVDDDISKSPNYMEKQAQGGRRSAPTGVLPYSTLVFFLATRFQIRPVIGRLLLNRSRLLMNARYVG